TMKIVRELWFEKAPERVANFLLGLPMSREDIADYLGLSTETVSRMLTHLATVSVIILPRSKTIIPRNHEVLKRLSA
ncbi:helix-turn-helix domain-containing protein, partial [Escherichia marmotae]|nr:helix-turn-helix domain-containing protein [Escherichia marmotae]